MKFLANENIPTATVIKLRDEGHDVFSVGVEFPSIKDEAVISLASSEDRIILTFDSDYGELIFKYGLTNRAGIVYFRIQNFQPAEPAEILLRLLSETEIIFENRFTVIAENNIRQRNL